VPDVTTDKLKTFRDLNSDKKPVIQKYEYKPGKFSPFALLDAAGGVATLASAADSFAYDRWYVGYAKFRSTATPKDVQSVITLTTIRNLGPLYSAMFDGTIGQILLIDENIATYVGASVLYSYAIVFSFYRGGLLGSGVTLGEIGKFITSLVSEITTRLNQAGYISTFDASKDDWAVFMLPTGVLPITEGEAPTPETPEQKKPTRNWWDDLLEDPNKMAIAIAVALILLILLLRR
jgi:hypothetical protein